MISKFIAWLRPSKDGRSEQSGAFLSGGDDSAASGNGGDLREENIGIKVLYDPTSVDLKTEIDIICIHGLNGHREKTWTFKDPKTGREVLWLRDFLPQELPNVRIMAFGYDSTVSSARYLTQRTLYSHSKRLLSALKSFRQEDDAMQRPLIFLSHGLGGIVVKSALIHADKDMNEFKDLQLSTSGVVFFGTPHQGNSETPWYKLVRNQVQQTLDLRTMRNTLDTDLELLQLQLEQYKPLSTNFLTCCFFEKEMVYITPGHIQIMPEFAVPVELSNAKTLLGPGSFPQSHNNLVKFGSRDSSYDQVVHQLLTVCRGSKELVAKNILQYRLLQGVSESYEYSFPDDFRIPPKLPMRPMQSFLGRDIELQEIHNILAPNSEDHVLVVSGSPGIGKSRLALEYAVRHRKNFHSVFWIDAQTQFNFYSSLLDIVKQLKDHYVPNAKSRDEESLRMLHYLSLHGLVDDDGEIQSCQENPGILLRAIRNWLEKSDNRAWLLVMDGVDDEDNLRTLGISDLLDSPASGRLLVTTRNLTLGNHRMIQLEGLKASDAVDLLRQTAQLGESSSNEDILRLVHILDKLPLAVSLAGSFLTKTKYSVKEYLGKISTERFPLSKTQTNSGTAMSQSLSTTWSISFEAIRKTDDEAAKLLDLIAFLSDKTIPIEILKVAFPKNESSGDSKIERPLNILRDFSLINQDHLTHTVSLDSRLSLWLREQLKDRSDYKKQASRACGVVTAYSRAIDTHRGVVPHSATKDLLDQRRLEEPIIQHIEKCVEYIDLLSEDDVDWVPLGNICRRHGRYDLAKRFYAVSISDHQSTYLNSVALEGDLSDMERFLGPNHLRTLQTAINLASQYQIDGEHGKAELIWRRADSARRKTLGLLHPLTLQTSTKLAFTLQQQGKYEQAKSLYLDTHNVVARSLGRYHIDTLRLLGNVAIVSTLQRYFDEARPIYQEVIEGMKRVLKPDHSELKNMVMHLELNDRERSSSTQREILDIFS